MREINFTWQTGLEALAYVSSGGGGGGFFYPLGTKLDLFGVFFLIHQHKNDLLGTNPHKIRSFWLQNTIFPSIFLAPIFSGPRHTPSNFRTEYPPRDVPQYLLYKADVSWC